MLVSIPSALDFFVNVIFICSCYSKVSELHYTFKEFKHCFFYMILSCILAMILICYHWIRKLSSRWNHIPSCGFCSVILQ